MRFAYADPPYLGCGALYAKHHPDALVWDDPETHRALIGRLVREFPDGWAMSSGSKGLHTILPMCPDDVRVMAWVKPFCTFFPNVKIARAWEPVILRGGRKRSRWEPTMRDWLAEPMAMRRGFPGAKPEAFCFWIFDVLNMLPDDDFHDLFPGSGAVGRAWEEWKRQPRLKLTEGRPKSAKNKGDCDVLPIEM